MSQPQELSSKVIDLETVPYLQSSSSTTTTKEEEEEDPSMPSKPRESESVEMTAVHHESCGVEHLDNGLKFMPVTYTGIILSPRVVIAHNHSPTINSCVGRCNNKATKAFYESTNKVMGS